MNTPLRALAALALLASNLHGQAGGFAEGDLYLYTRAATGLTYADGGLIHISPHTVQTSLLFGFDHSSLMTGAAAFDPHRKRVVFSASIGDPTGVGTFSLFTTDAAGSIERIVHPARSYLGLSPTGDGRVYLCDPYDVFQPFQWLDDANRLHTLFDADGVTAFQFGGVVNHTASAMTYDPVRNALFFAGSTIYGVGCNGAGGTDVTIRRIPLSADGTRVAGPVTCTQVDVDLLQATEKPVNWSRGPNGDLLLVVDNVNLTDVFPRLLRVDPQNLAVTAFAQNGGYPGAADGTAGAYSSALGKALVLDTKNDVLRAFASGETGAGTVLVPNGPLSWNPGSNEIATLFEVRNGPCAGGVQAYGAGTPGSGGVVPTLTASGCPAVGSALTVRLDDVVGAAPGYLMLGLSEAAIPYKGGALYLSPIAAWLPVQAGGAAGAPGAGHLDLPFGTLADPALAGLTVVAQAIVADGGTPAGVALTQGLRLEIE